MASKSLEEWKQSTIEFLKTAEQNSSISSQQATFWAAQVVARKAQLEMLENMMVEDKPKEEAEPKKVK